ncbi:MAG: THUMP domain-containing protein, partial [Deltaproteobacteria bacterium]|nr:THUMP domain-containing protein [Deltaproteobacteria bacterium]
YNILVMKVDNIRNFLETLREWVQDDPHILSLISRVMPVTQTFNFQSAEEFKEKASEAASKWVSMLTNRSFHIRMHRRGFKGKIASNKEERFLDDFLLDALKKEGMKGDISFQNPDVIVVVETVGSRAGMSIWTREDLERYPFLRLD